MSAVEQQPLHAPRSPPSPALPREHFAPPVLRISNLAIVTQGRLPSAVDSAQSFVENAIRADRKVTLTVFDDSNTPATTKAAFQYAAFDSRFGVQVRLFDNSCKDRFVSALAGRTGVSPSLVRFLVMDPLGVGSTRGANTNALILEMAGEPFFCFDDDVFCRPARPSAAFLARIGINTNDSEPSPLLVLPFASASDLCTAAESTNEDLLLHHEHMLAREILPIGELYKRSSPRVTGPVISGGRVVCTWSSFYGDTGSMTQDYCLFLDGAARRLLTASPEQYHAAVRSRLTWRTSLRPVAVRTDYFQSVAFALWNADPPPPFWPILRGSDTVFGSLLRYCVPGALYGYVPLSVDHSPRPPRIWDKPAHWVPDWPTTGRIVSLLVQDYAAGRAETNLSLEGFADSIIRLAKEGERALAATVKKLWHRYLRLQLTRLEAACAIHTEGPHFWQSDVAQRMARTRAQLATSHMETLDGGDMYRLCFMLRSVGEALLEWRHIWTAAAEMRRSGHQMSAPV